MDYTESRTSTQTSLSHYFGGDIHKKNTLSFVGKPFYILKKNFLNVADLSGKDAAAMFVVKTSSKPSEREINNPISFWLVSVHGQIYGTYRKYKLGFIFIQ